MGEIIRQTFNLYNTVGLIDKGKNIYFVPHQADIYSKVTAGRTKVCDCYYELFNQVSPFSSKYQNTEISQWSPEDRQLVIEGIIDDFRQSRGQGLALNYLIINRAIYEVEGETETLVSNYYFAMFIESVEQIGSRAVKLNLTPDYFTNFYYLNNNDTLTSTYDPFNPVMKNCFVERQHYDRFARTDNGYEYINLKKILGSEESFKYKYQYKSRRQFFPLDNFDTTLYNQFCNNLKAISSKEEFISYFNNSRPYEDKWFAELVLSYLNILFKEDILPPISYTDTLEGSVNKAYYKAGYNKYKGVAVPFTHVVIPFIVIPKGFENIKKEWITLEYGFITNNVYSKMYEVVGEDNYSPASKLQYLSNIGATQHILTTYVSKYSPLIKKYRNIRLGANSLSIMFQTNPTEETAVVTSMSNLYQGNKTVILSDTKMSLLPFSFTEGDGNYTKQVLDDTLACYVGDILNPDTSIGALYYFDHDTNLWSFTTPLYYFSEKTAEDPIRQGTRPIDTSKLVFVLGDSELDEIDITIQDTRVITINNYFDPVLESDPYCFYSLSINGVEQIISKMRLIENYYGYDNEFSFKLKPILSYNEAYKIGLIPIFKINNNWERYYNEAIVSISSSEVPVKDDSWLTFYVTNKAQMKNQYAVQYNNFESGLAQGVVSMFTDTGVGAIKGSQSGAGGYGALAGTVKGFGNIINGIISNKYQVDNITLSQQAKMSDMGAKPDTIKFAGSDILYDMIQNERGFYLNYYRIDEVSYNSACKYLERFGYLVNIFDTINVFDRIGLNYVKITSFDFVEDDFVLSQEQMDAIHTIFEEGVTLLHDHDYLHNLGEVIDNVNYHNYELSLA